MDLDKIAQISLKQARDHTGHDLWVLNTSDLSGITDDNRRGVLRFSVNVPGEIEPVAITVPATWLPQDLGTFVDRQLILKSPRFLTAHRDRHLVIIADDEAQGILSTPEARSEITRLQVNQNRNVNITKGDPKSDLKAGIQPWVLETIQRKDLSDSERAALFRSNAANLKLADIDYALSELANTSNEATQYLRKRRLDIKSR